jgi:uncharacterized protein with von Willebrand factor type A (vWA) domain
MEQVFFNFIGSLRSSGIPVSVPESIDAAEVFKLVGYGDRIILRDSLSAVLAKSCHEKDVFERCFDLFFSHDAFSAREDRRAGETIREQSENLSSLSQMLLSGDNSGLSMAMRDAAAEINVSGIQFFTQKGLYFHRIINQMGFAGLEADISRLSGETLDFSIQQADRLVEGRAFLFDSVKEFVAEQLELFSGTKTEEIIEWYMRNVKLSDLEERDYQWMHMIIQKMVKRLNDLYSRRKKAFQRGVLDFKKTIRKNVAYDGLLFDTWWKIKKIDRPDIVAICDMSRSVERAVRFLLLILYSLNETVAKIRTFIFCSNLVEATHVFEKYPVEEALIRMQKGIDLGIQFGPTDYGQAFKDFRNEFFDTVTRKTTVLILGDGRSNYGNPETLILKALGERAKRLIWLNPEPPSFWGTGDSEMKRYRPYCHLVKECSNITQLERVVHSLLKFTG